MSAKRWNLVADIGGTNARFGLQDQQTGQLVLVKRYSVSEHREFDEVLTHFLKDVTEASIWRDFPQGACLAVACPVEGDRVAFTNSPWTVDRLKVASQLKGVDVQLINDFTAVAHAVTHLKPADWYPLGGASLESDRPIAILGPGTGLGVSILVPTVDGYQVVEGEGGHVDFAPCDEQETAIMDILRERFGRVSVERLLSGSGIMNIYSALSQLAGERPNHQTPAAITEAALQGGDALSVNTLNMFCGILGSVAGNIALTVGAKGGVYIAGGIVPNMVPFLENSDFRRRFDAKGRFKTYLANIPVRVILKDDLGLVGAIHKLNLSAY